MLDIKYNVLNMVAINEITYKISVSYNQSLIHWSKLFNVIGNLYFKDDDDHFCYESWLFRVLHLKYIRMIYSGCLLLRLRN